MPNMAPQTKQAGTNSKSHQISAASPWTPDHCCIRYASTPAANSSPTSPRRPSSRRWRGSLHSGQRKTPGFISSLSILPPHAGHGTKPGAPGVVLMVCLGGRQRCRPHPSCPVESNQVDQQKPCAGWHNRTKPKEDEAEQHPKGCIGGKLSKFERCRATTPVVSKGKGSRGGRYRKDDTIMNLLKAHKAECPPQC